MISKFNPAHSPYLLPLPAVGRTFWWDADGHRRARREQILRLAPLEHGAPAAEPTQRTTAVKPLAARTNLWQSYPIVFADLKNDFVFRRIFGGLLQVQYAFLELPKLTARKPATGVELWAWLFVNGPEPKEMPADLPQGPHREAVELANQATFTYLELEAYRKVMDEIQQAREYGEAQRAQGWTKGEAKGEASAMRKR